MKILITSGGTKIPIDRVRSITNMSSGTFGSAICANFLQQMCDVDFVMAEGSKTPFELRLNGEDYLNARHFEYWQGWVKEHRKQYKAYTYKTYEDYAKVIAELLTSNTYDVIVLAAAVSDYGVANYVDGKIRTSASLEIQLEPLGKIISNVRVMQPKAYLVGFKLLVDSKDEELIEAAQDSIKRNGCDMIVANDLRDIQQDNHRLLLVTPSDGVVIKTKQGQSSSLAHVLVDAILKKVNGWSIT